MSDLFKESESRGHIKSLKAKKEDPVEVTPTSELAIDNPEDFRMAIGNAQMEGLDYIEVTEKLFSYLVKNNKTNYLTYGEPGIKVFKVGTREEIQRLENMSAEEHLNYTIKMKQKNG